MLSRQNLSAKPVVSNPPSKGSRVYFSLLNARSVATWATGVHHIIFSRQRQICLFVARNLDLRISIVSNASEITVQQLCKPWLLEGCWSNEAQLSLPIVLSSLGFGKKLMYI
jgi:hypothetical protein